MYLYQFLRKTFLLGLFSITSLTHANETKPTKVLFIGDSITQGYGLPREAAYPAIVAEMLAEEGILINVQNAGVNGQTIAGGASSLKWQAKMSDYDVLVILLGGNDALRGNYAQNFNAMYEDYKNLIEMSFESHPNAPVLVCRMMAPTNMGKAYIEGFNKVFKRIEEDKRITMTAFILEGVATITEMNQADGIHPNHKGHKKIAENLYIPLKKVIVKQ
ncbi:MAG: GDSL-type esterase/lipase family protein [Lentisphaeria bacterium]|nr:GDSL-type esterase/lipase family protein [Lentisphaeria bacterium]